VAKKAGRPLTSCSNVRGGAVDWSGAASREDRHLSLAATVDDAGGGPGRLSALQPMTRAQGVDHVVAAAARDANLLVGLDFAFSFPSWWLEENGIEDAASLWADQQLLEGWLARCPPPFWGRPGRPRPTWLRPEQQWRLTELACSPRPKSAFQIGGAGAVGTASVRGMPWLAVLRREGFSVWPFDPPRLPLVVEMWPRLLTGPVVKSRLEARDQYLAAARASGQLELSDEQQALATRSEDAFDAAVSASGLHRQAGAMLLALRTGAAPQPADDPAVRLEGWVWGVPGRR
jgi:hypothetical protein